MSFQSAAQNPKPIEAKNLLSPGWMLDPSPGFSEGAPSCTILAVFQLLASSVLTDDSNPGFVVAAVFVAIKHGLGKSEKIRDLVRHFRHELQLMWTGNQPKSMKPGTSTIPYVQTNANINADKTNNTLVVTPHMPDFVCLM